MRRRVAFLMAGAVCALLLAACSGGSGNGDTGIMPSPTAGGSSTSGASGVPSGSVKSACRQPLMAIEGTGMRRFKGVLQAVDGDSVVVNDVDYSIRDASILINGECRGPHDLGVGHVVTVIGSADEQTTLGTAAAVYSDDDVAGPILAIDADHGTLNVAGQTVVVDTGTVFADSIRPGELSALAPRQQVAVSGVVGVGDVLVAKRIDLWPSNAGWRVSGTVAQLDTDQQLFHINQVPVRYADSVLIDFPTGTVTHGDIVRVQGGALWGVEGYPCCEPDDGGINATAVAYVDYLSANPSVVVAGLLTRFGSAGDFEVNDQTVTTDRGTKFVGLGFEWVSVDYSGFWITVIGRIDNRGVLHAALVDVGNSASVELQAPVTSIDPEARTVTIASVPVDVSSATVITQLEGGGERRIAFTELNVGNQLYALGDLADPPSHLAAFRLRQSAPSQRFYIRHWLKIPLGQPPYFSLSIGSLSLVIETTEATHYYYGHTLGGGCSCSAHSAATFWGLTARAGPDHFKSVEVIGTWTGEHVVAEKVYWMDE